MDGPHYLTRMEINPRRRAARRYLGSPQVMHAAVEAAFPASSAGERRLWRIDRVGEGVWLYLTSASRPDLTHVVEEIGRPATQGWETKDYVPFLDRLAAGQVWAFRGYPAFRPPHGDATGGVVGIPAGRVGCPLRRHCPGPGR